MPPEPLTRADVLTGSEASALLGIPLSTRYELARRGALPPARQIVRRWIFCRSLLDRATLPQSEPESLSTGPAADSTRTGARLTSAGHSPAVRSVRGS
jgi:helix-turn-helix protein